MFRKLLEPKQIVIEPITDEYIKEIKIRCDGAGNYTGHVTVIEGRSVSGVFVPDFSMERTYSAEGFDFSKSLTYLQIADAIIDKYKENEAKRIAEVPRKDPDISKVVTKGAP